MDRLGAGRILGRKSVNCQLEKLFQTLDKAVYHHKKRAWLISVNPFILDYGLAHLLEIC